MNLLSIVLSLPDVSTLPQMPYLLYLYYSI